MNLSDHSESIHKSIQKPKDLKAHIKEDNGSWLDDLFKGQNPAHWSRELCKVGLCVLVILEVVLVVVPCILVCVQQMMDKSIK